MAPLPTIEGVLRVTMNWHTNSGANAHDVLHFATLLGDEDGFLVAFGEHANNAMIGTMSDQAHLVGLDVIRLDGTSASKHYTLDGSYTGTANGAAIIQAATIVSIYTTQRGPSRRGRIFLPFVSEGAQDNGFLDGGDVDDVSEGWNLFKSEMDADDYRIGVASYTLEEFTQADTLTCKNVVGTQRRRVDQLR